MPDLVTAAKNPPRPRSVADVRRLLVGEDTFATTLLVLAVDSYGPECLEWHPRTLLAEFHDDWQVMLPSASLDRLMAAITVITTDLFFQDVSRFVQLANVLAFDEFDPGQFDPADSVECAWAVTEALLLNPPDDEDPEPFCDDVRRYIGMVLRDEGFITPPDILRIALEADWSAQVQYAFAEDEALFEGVYDVQRDKTNEVNGVVRESLHDLLEQLSALPLRRGDVTDLAQRIRRTLAETAGSGADHG